MNKKELIEKLEYIKKQGFVKSSRKGTTGIGKTFENLLGVKENNLALPDIGGLEIKTARKGSSSRITLFTLDNEVWKIKPEELIKNYGYDDNKGRKALKRTLTYGKGDSLYVEIEEIGEKMILIKNDKGEVLGSFNPYQIAARFLSKFGKVLYVKADVKKEEEQECFHFNEFYILSEPKYEDFIEGIKSGAVVIDLRMHLDKDKQGVRNRGTAFRIREDKLLEIFGKKEKLL